MARERLSAEEQKRFVHLLTRHTSPLERAPGLIPPKLQRGKETNVAIAARHIDGVVVRPYEIVSYHRLVGRPSFFRGFRKGLELHHGEETAGIGGGCCQISNMLYQVALEGGQKIMERHRHGIDLFPDANRKVPFGCGATVFYNYVDLRFENPLPVPVLLRFCIKDRTLIGEIWAEEPPDWSAEIYETEHRFYCLNGVWMRENRIRRRFRNTHGAILLDQEIAHNVAQTRYTPYEAEEKP